MQNETDIHKQADDKHWSYAFIPGHQFLGLETDMSKYPKVFTNAGANRTLWNTLGAVATTGAITAAIAASANKLAERKWDAAKRDKHRNKVNALFAFSTPNKATDQRAVTAVRNIGIGSTKKKIDEDKVKELENKEQPSIIDIAAVKELLPKAASLPKKADWEIAGTMLPLLATVPAALGVYNLVRDDVKEVRKEELDKRILEERNKLDALYAELLKRRSNIAKQAKGDDSEGSPGLWEGAGAFLGLGLIGAPLLSSLIAYHYTKKHDDTHQRMKLLKDQIISQNLTNIPDTLEVITGEDESIPETRKEQKYIDQLNKAVEDLG